MAGLYTEADYENSVIELFRNDLGYETHTVPILKETFTVRYMRKFCLTLCTA